MIEVETQEVAFSANFTIRVTGLRVSNIGSMLNVIKEVDWVIIGEQKGKTLELPQTTHLPDPITDLFTPINTLSEADIISWIRLHDKQLINVKKNIQGRLNEEVAKTALEVTKMPWAIEEVIEAP